MSESMRNEADGFDRDAAMFRYKKAELEWEQAYVVDPHRRRLERIATAVLAGIMANKDNILAFDSNGSPSKAADMATRYARALIAELDKEEPR